MMNGTRKSDGPVVPVKSPNKASRMAAEAAEGRSPTKGNTNQRDTPRTQSRTRVPSSLERVRQAAKKDKGAKFTALLHHVTVDRLRAAFHALRRKAAPGVDGVTCEQYQADLEANLVDLHGRVHRGAYRAKPSRRAFIPKPDGRQRPLGIAALEDKLVQRAVGEVMSSIYEEDFLGFSYGFRPGRSPHDALDALAVGLERKQVNWVLDADIRGFFDAVDHGWLRKFIEHRIKDQRVLRLVERWLDAGVMEKGTWASTGVGTPQGATISPLLANIYLHYVFDLWAQQWRNRRAQGGMLILRYADDFVVGFEDRSDAERFLSELRERLSQFALELHPEKTRLIEFGRRVAARRASRGERRPETFNFLGLTHYCGRSKKGRFLLKRQTMKQRMQAKLKEVRQELRLRRHHSIPEQGAWIAAVLRGYFAYHSVPTNIRRLARFRTEVIRHWHRSLERRSQRGRINWARMKALVNRWVPPVRMQHPWPNERFDAKTQGKSRVR